MSAKVGSFPTATHWGNYLVASDNGKITAIEPVVQDEEPSDLGQSLLDALDQNCRIDQPMVRKGYFEAGAKSDRRKRGKDAFVPVDWPTAIKLAAEALERVRANFGSKGIYAASYGWGSAGRFHHPQSQMHRFMKLYGGYTDAYDSYSVGAGNVLTERVLGMDGYSLSLQIPPWKEVAENAELVVLFGGAPAKNAQASPGGLSKHSNVADMMAAKRAGAQFVNVSPIRDDVAIALEADWLDVIPNTDTALMLALAHTLFSEELHDASFLRDYTSGFERFLPYLMGETDGQPKSADWAEKICGIAARRIVDLARQMARRRTMISVTWSLQRADKGEQPWWMAIGLAAMLGQIGLPGRGVGFGYNCTHDLGSAWELPFKWAALPQGKNEANSAIPVARFADMLLDPGGEYEYNGTRGRYPEIGLVYWCGGNPFHHHQDINRLLEAWYKPDTVIINDHFWTASARHADIVFPVSTMLERNDLGCNSSSNFLIPMRRAVEPFRQSKTDYAIFSMLADALGFGSEFTESRDEQQWLEHLYAISSKNAAASGYELPAFEDFWAGGQIELVRVNASSAEAKLPGEYLQAFRRDPHKNKLNTPSGKIEIFSDTINNFGYDDCLGHPTWMEPAEWLGSDKAEKFPLHLLSNNPKTRLHSQYDHGRTSIDSKVNGREPVRLNPLDAHERSIGEGDVVRIFNDRGACLAGAVIDDNIRRGVIQISTGAWYDPLHPGDVGSLDVHGNPNMLTLDKGSSKLGQGCSANTALVEAERYEGEAAPVKIFCLPKIEV